MAQPWWDPEGFILVVDESAARDTDHIAAFHWTKVDPPDGDTGEVYVVGVCPDRQGEGLGKAVTVLGLDHLKARGLRDVVLYVDEDNVAAVRTYANLGFTDREVHRQYALVKTHDRAEQHPGQRPKAVHSIRLGPPVWQNDVTMGT